MYCQYTYPAFYELLLTPLIFEFDLLRTLYSCDSSCYKLFA